MVGSRTVVSLLAVCLLCVAVGAVASAATGQGESSEIRHPENTTGYLSPTNVTADGYAQTDIDVGSAITDDAQSLHARQDRLRFDERFERASDNAQRRAVVESAVREINASVTELRQRQEQLFAAYGADEIGERALIRKLITVTAVADRQRQFIDHVEQTVSEASGVPLPSNIQDQIEQLGSEPLLQPGPVDEQLRTEVTTTGAETTYVQGSETALVLVTVVDGTQYRQATMLDERVGTGEDTFASSENGWFDAATQRAEQLYPWAWANFEGGGGDILAGLPYYFVDVSHPHGTLELYFDGTSANVFREHQRNSPGAIPVSETHRTTTSTLELTVETTHPTGPMLITVSEPGSAEPIQTTLEINGQPIGTTDWEYWAVQPEGNFTVSATTANNETAVVSGP
ncbi:DUF7096 domain-containing protein [Halovenus marina]|uniref:DUF7096 domain-containing protein n=1 Tax=Halovenus marina TaxID=3396621 RepID=UPI003F57AF11